MFEVSKTGSHVVFYRTMVQALPIFLDKMFNEWVAVMLSVTFVLAFGEVKFILNLGTSLYHEFQALWVIVAARGQLLF